MAKIPWAMRNLNNVMLVMVDLEKTTTRNKKKKGKAASWLVYGTFNAAAALHSDVQWRSGWPEEGRFSGKTSRISITTTKNNLYINPEGIYCRFTVLYLNGGCAGWRLRGLRQSKRPGWSELSSITLHEMRHRDPVFPFAPLGSPRTDGSAHWPSGKECFLRVNANASACVGN